MRGRIITSDHRIFELPVLLRWNITYTGGVPCDSYEVTCVYDRTMAELLHLAAGFLALDENGGVLLRGIVDEYEVKLTAAGLAVTICGRGYAARLLDNESRPVTYQGATLAEIVRCPCGALRHFQRGDRAGVGGLCLHRAAGTSQWKALEGFCRTYGAFRPASGGTAAGGGAGAGRRAADRHRRTTPILSCTPAGGPLRCADGGAGHRQDPERVLQRAEPGHAGPGAGQCRRVVYTPGQSTWAAMRYTGEYQIRRSREEELTIELGLAGCFPAFPGDTVRLELEAMGLSRRVPGGRGGKHGLPETGEVCTLILRERI